jgi:hypothetical protein
VVIIPSKYVDEIRTLTGDKTRGVEPFIKDFCAEITNGMCFLDSDLQNRVVQQRLTPILGTLAPVMKKELDYALLKEMPGCRGEVYPIFTFDFIMNQSSNKTLLEQRHGPRST